MSEAAGTRGGKPRVGYVGLGIMGAPMAANLLQAGFPLSVWNRTASKAAPLVEKGAAAADSPAELASGGAEIVCVNVTDTPDVEAVCFGDRGIAAGARPGLLVIDHSTIGPVATQGFARRFAEKGVTFLDAPVSGGDVGARNATLSIMVGGDEAAFARALPVLRAMGKAVTHVGASGMGQVCKACNQVAGMLNLLGACEALALAKRCGLNLGKMIEVVGAGAAGSWQLANLGPKIAAGDDAPGFMIDLVLKDLHIVAETAREKQLPLHATALVEGYFRAVAADGGGRLGTQAIRRTLEKLGHFRYADGEPGLRPGV